MLKIILDSIDDLPEDVKEHYSPKDGKFILDLDGDMRAHPKGLALQAAIDRLKKEKKDLTDKLTAVEAKIAELPEDFDAEKYAAQLDELAALKAKGEGGDDPEAQAAAKKLYEQRIEKLKTDHAAAVLKLNTEKAELVAQIEKLVADDGLTKALVAAGVDKKLLPGATALLRRSIKVKQDEDTGEWIGYFATDAGEATIADHVSNWAQSDDGAVYITKATGGDADGGKGGSNGYNPWVADAAKGVKPNLTAQQELMRTNPTKARAMASAAGVTLPAVW